MSSANLSLDPFMLVLLAKKERFYRFIQFHSIYFLFRIHTSVRDNLVMYPSTQYTSILTPLKTDTRKRTNLTQNLASPSLAKSIYP
jgi:hypothetical protein